MEKIKVFAPATVANLSCGFDVLGCCLDSIGDEMMVKKNDLKEVRILKITGQDLPLETEKNVAGVSIMALLKALGSTQGFDLEIIKKIKPGSGIGSSAASSAGAVYAVNKLLGDPFTNKELIAFAMEGEKLASGNAHADNVAPALLGGFSLVKSYNPLEIIALPSPPQLRAVILHPLIELNTKYSRSILQENVCFKDAVSQWGNVGALVSALYTEDYELFGRSLEDKIVEPLRSKLIPFFDELKETALCNGALGFGISGSGPSIFALSKGKEMAEKVAKTMAETYETLNIDYDIHVSKVNVEGCRILN